MRKEFQVLVHPIQADFLSCPAPIRSFVGGRGSGKSLIISTPLPTPTGWVTMGDVNVGDALLDEHGLPCKVVSATEVMNGRPCYEVTFRDEPAGKESTVIADAEHEWPVWAGAEKPTIHTTRSLAEPSLIRGGKKTLRCPQVDTRASAREVLLVGVRPVDSVPVRCVQVDSPNHLYLASRECIPTHNSFIGAYDLLSKACAKSGRLYMVVAPTYSTLREASMRTFLKLALKLNKVVSVNRSNLRVVLDSTSEVIFRSADHPDSLRGPNLSGVWMDEAQNSDEEAYTIALACLREAEETGFLTATFTPHGRRHWTYEKFGRNEELRRKYLLGEESVDPSLIDPDVYLFHCSTADNPFLPEGFEHRLRRQYTSSLAEQELGGEFTDPGGKMFQRAWFDDQFVLAAPRVARRVRYWDKANCLLSNSMIACERGNVQIENVKMGDRVMTRSGYREVQWAGRTKVANLVIRVWLSNGQSLSGTPEHLVWTSVYGWKPLGMLTADDVLLAPDGESVRVFSMESQEVDGVPVYDLTVEGAEEFFANGILVHNSKKGGSWTAGVLIAWDYDGKFYVEHVVHGQWTAGTRDAEIKLTARMDNEKYGYGAVSVYVEQEPGPIWEEELVQMADGRRLVLRDVAAGDEVINKDGVATRVEAIHIQGMLPTLRITTDSGRMIHAAGNHPFLTPGGWVDAQHLQVGDALALRSGSITKPSEQPSLEECRLAGYFVGDGCCTPIKGRENCFNAKITCTDDLQGADMLRCAKAVGAIVKIGGQKKCHYNFSGGARLWLIKRGLARKDTSNKNVPEWIMTASDECVANFIGAFFACDGCISFATKGGFSVEFYNTNPTLLSEIQSLLLRFGVFCRLRVRRYQPEFQKTRRYCYRLIIPKNSDFAAKFAERIPVFGKKKARLDRLRRSAFDQPYLADQIISIERDGELPCRCLTVASGESFLVNDIVVHNSGGKESAENSIRMLAGNIVRKDKVTGKKHVRAEPFAAMCEARNVFLVQETDRQKPWIADWLDEICSFPDGKFSDQCLVGDSMVATECGQVKISEILPGDMVWTRNGLRSVLRSGITGFSRRLIEVSLANGSILIGTGNHPVLDGDDNFISLGSVKESHIITVADSRPQPEGWMPWATRADQYCQPPMLSSLMAYPIEDTYTHFSAVVKNGQPLIARVRVLRVRTIIVPSPVPVYNLTVDDCPEFFANGFIVHNCDASSGAFNMLIQGSYSSPVTGGSSGQGTPASGSIRGQPGIQQQDRPIANLPGYASGPGTGNMRNFKPI